MRLAISRDGLNKSSEMKDYFAQLASFAIQEGLPAQKNASRTWRSAEALQNNAETATWAILNASALGIGANDQTLALVRIEWKTEQDFAQLLDRLGKRRSRINLLASRQPISHSGMTDYDPSGLVPEFSVRACLAFVQAERAMLFEAYLDSADLRNANLRGANLSGAHLCNAAVSGANSNGRSSIAHTWMA